jgi:hypothetical protein
MTDPNDSIAPRWSAPPSSKTKNAIQRAVTALLDQLAPERVLKRAEQLRVPVEQHRTPNGCVLQAESAALSVSWFTGAGNDAGLGELHVVVWKGIVSRRGSPKRKEGATVVREIVFRPLENPTPQAIWKGDDSAEYSTDALAALCTELLDEQVAKES